MSDNSDESYQPSSQTEGDISTSPVRDISENKREEEIKEGPSSGFVDKSISSEYDRSEDEAHVKLEENVEGKVTAEGKGNWLINA